MGEGSAFHLGIPFHRLCHKLAPANGAKCLPFRSGMQRLKFCTPGRSRDQKLGNSPCWTCLIDQREEQHVCRTEKNRTSRTRVQRWTVRRRQLSVALHPNLTTPSSHPGRLHQLTGNSGQRSTSHALLQPNQPNHHLTSHLSQDKSSRGLRFAARTSSDRLSR